MARLGLDLSVISKRGSVPRAARLERERGRLRRERQCDRAAARRGGATRRRDAAARGLQRTAPPERKRARRPRERERDRRHRAARKHARARPSARPHRALARGNIYAGLCAAARLGARDLATALAPRAVVLPPASWPGHALTRWAGSSSLRGAARGALWAGAGRPARARTHSNASPLPPSSTVLRRVLAPGVEAAPWPASRPRRGGTIPPDKAVLVGRRVRDPVDYNSSACQLG